MSPSEFRSAFFDWQVRDSAVIVTISRAQLSEEENIDVLGKELVDLVDQYGYRQIVVSLQQVAYMTSAALGKLITLHRRLHRKAGRLIVCSAIPAVKDILHASRLDDYFTITDDIPAALSLLSPG